MDVLGYKVWNKEDQRMYYVETLDFGSTFDLQGGVFIYDQWLPFEKCVLLQSTGLKDEKGEEIYEGDLVKCTYLDFTESEMKTAKEMGADVNIKEVVWHPYHACFLLVDKEWLEGKNDAGYEIFNKRNVKYEVIGNIYENATSF